ncbi:MAG: hypothetical protein A3J08_04305 [Candidatus Lloydbacteria bacterium RIFCSPLOWO2_02_FULL_51_11]|uniref:Uncharacterized protein n=1 Tax=Candidatus Lloydbacteria bacterium RIFCSPLOWO2_02_FULL_51_11 TaxID=1798667 RepID=A0A1G2DPL0_9BACT|nr:MAG: hypothetical protein A3J08_04305 [Candidatus Lloydbacteria bacterium RIFCSPLOWO2_02_FULL_51_11]
MTIFERIKKFNLPRGEYAVFGSALLDVWGIRKAADLDIIVTPDLFAFLKQSGWEERQAHGFPMLSKEEANVTTVQDEPTDGNYCPDRRQLIKDAVYINEVPFVKIEEVIACKKAYDREKDRKDIVAIKKYLSRCGERTPYHVV